jgi:hypothetical protein
MAKIVKVYCEGKAESPDYVVLGKVIEGLIVQINPIGSKLGAGSAIQVYESGASKSDFKLFFRDRDFDAPISEVEKLIPSKQNKYTYYSYRTTIENYFLEYDSMKSYWELKGWNTDDLKDVYYSTAKKIRYFQAVRHTLGELRIPTDFGSNITEKSGILPKELSSEYCREKGFEKIVEKTQSTQNSWSRENYDRVFNKFVDLFNDSFIENNKFLIYFQGKDFMKAFSKELDNFVPENYYKYAKAKFDYTKFQDLVELRNILENNIKTNR